MPDMESARVFVALKPPQAVSQLVTRYQKNLQEAIADRGPGTYFSEGKHSYFVRWTAEDSLHVTLHFIGSVSRSILGSFQASFREKTCNFKPFKVSLGSLGFLPRSRRNMRVVYLGVLDAEKNLDYLASVIRSCVKEKLGLDSEPASAAGSDLELSTSNQETLEERQGFQRGLNQLPGFNDSLSAGFEKRPESNCFNNQRDSPFLPHITLGRLEKTAKREDKEYLASLISKYSIWNVSPFHCSDKVDWEVNSFIFYESVQENGLPRYKILEEFHF